MNISGHDYEKLCAQYLECIGYSHVHKTSGSGDQGVDIVATRNGENIAIQCKLWAKPVSNKAVQEVYGGMRLYGCTRAVVITNNKFTPSAIELARADDVILLSGRTPESMIEVIKEEGLTPCTEISIDPIHQFDGEERINSQSDSRLSTKSQSLAFILCILFGPFGAHYFYVGRGGMGFLYFITLGLFLFGWIYDLYRIASGRFFDKYGLVLKDMDDE